MKFFAFLIFYMAGCFTLSLKAQGASDNKKLKRIDSLQKELTIALKDTSKVNLLNNISINYKNLNDFENAMLFGKQALALAKKIEYRKGEAKALYFIGAALKANGNYKSALDYNLQSLKMFKNLPDKKMLATNVSEIGGIYRVMGDFNKALDYQLKALKMREEIGDKKDIPQSLNAVGSVYSEKGEFQKALEYLLQSAKLSQEANERKSVASTYNNIANVYLALGTTDKALDYYLLALDLNEKSGNLKWKAVNLNNISNIYSKRSDFVKALKYLQESLAIKEQIGDKGGIASTLMNLGITYGNLKDFQKSIDYGERSLAIREDIGDKGGIAECLRSLGLSYGELKQYNKAIEYLNRGIKLGEKIGARSSLQLCYLNLSSVYEKLNDQKNALKYYKLSAIEKDSILNMETNQNMAKMSAQFDSEKKDNEIKLLNKDKEKQEALTSSESKKQKIIIASITGGFIFLLVFVFFVYRSYRQKKTDNIEIIRQKEIIEEKNIEVHSSITYAKRIQKAILPSDKILNEALANSFILFKPKDIVSGDFYWIQKIGNKVLFAVVDCTGHGVPGALMSVIGHSALNRTVKEFGLTSPAAILDKLNFLVEETFESAEDEVKDGMDISLCSLDINTNKLEWAGANNPLWIINNGELLELKADKQPIGKFINRKPFTGHSLQLQKNDSIYIFTDGLADQFGGPKGKKFKYKKIKDLLLQSINNTPEQQKKIILNALTKWKGELEQVDDICVMGIKI